MMIPQPHSSGDDNRHTMTFGAVCAEKSPSFLFLVAAVGTEDQKRRAGRVLAGSDQPSEQEPHGEK
ncbi:MAG: hypothetical protein PHE83_16185 [Opitutaceae bacterium]|nr:hypothetical protein [Opitutaceae bacterium]